jgi:tetratricopeptide (TPR) repeat protein
MSRGSDVSPLLLKAAKRFEPLDRRLARETYLEALAAALFAGRLASGGSVVQAARAARAAPPASQPSRASDLLLDGLARLITEGNEAGTPTLKRAVRAFRREDIPREERLRWQWLACRAAALLWDDEAWDSLSARFIQVARDAGALTVLPLALTTRSGAQLFAGELAMASSLVDEAVAVNEATGSNIASYAGLALVAFQGREADVSELIEAGTREVVRRADGQGLSFIHWAIALLNNGLGRYEEALDAGQQAAEDQPASWSHNGGLVELIEAGARSGKAEPAADALRRLSDHTRASGTNWVLGVELRSRALLSDDAIAEALYRQAVEALARTRVRVELARAHLLYGEWLRRERRRLDAASSYGMPTTCSWSSAWRRSLSAPASCSTRPASMPANGPTTPVTS